MQSIQNKKKIDEIIWEQEQLLLSVGRRLAFLNAYNDEIENLAHQSGVRFKNESLFQLVRDSYSMVVIDLCAICANLFSDKDSFFSKIMGEAIDIGPLNLSLDDVSEPEPVYINPSGIDEEYMRIRNEHWRVQRLTEDKEYIKQAMEKAFGYFKEKITFHDLEDLRLKYLPLIDEMKKSRDHLAHRFEKNERKKAVHIKTIPVKRLTEIFNSLKDLLHNLRFISTHSSLAYSSIDPKEYSTDAKDLITILIHGSLDWPYMNLKNTEKALDSIRPFEDLRSLALESERPIWLLNEEVMSHES